MRAIAPLSEATIVEDGLNALRVGLLFVDENDIVRRANAHFGHLFPDSPSPIGAAFGDYLEVVAHRLACDAALWAASRMHRLAAGDLVPADLPLADGRIIEIKERELGQGGLVQLWTDVTQARRQGARLEDVIETSSEGFAFFGPDGRLELWNDGFATALGGADGAPRGATLGRILGAARASQRITIVGDAPPFDAMLDRATPRRDFIINHIDGRFLRLRLRPSRGGGAVAVITDLKAERAQGEALARRGSGLADASAALRASRERLRMQTASLLGLKEELFRTRRDAESAAEAKKSFLRAVSHELRTPLNSIIGFSDFLAEEPHGALGSPRYGEYVGQIRSAGRRLLGIVERILDITRLEAGIAQLAFETEPLAPIAAASIAAASRKAREAGVTLKPELAADLPAAFADAEAVRAILDNLLDNAIAHTPAGGAVTLRGGASEDEVTLAVIDTGRGIAPEDLERVMLPFEQAGAAPRREDAGPGLGLAIVKAFAEALGGRFTLDSALGEGTAATLALKRAPGEGQRAG